MEQGWDPEVVKFFRKILNTIATGLLWMMAVLTAGVYFGLAHHSNLLYVILFYLGLAVSLGLLLRYYYRMWK
jgi:membrane protease YdiL (CAAX protease family)